MRGPFIASEVRPTIWRALLKRVVPVLAVILVLGQVLFSPPLFPAISVYRRLGRAPQPEHLALQRVVHDEEQATNMSAGIKVLALILLIALLTTGCGTSEPTTASVPATTTRIALTTES